MASFILVVRKLGELAIDYLIPFQADFLPREGDYFSIRRPGPQLRRLPIGDGRIRKRPPHRRVGRCRWNHTAAATALSLTYDQFRHAVRRHELQG